MSDICYHIDFDLISNIVTTGVRRAAVFMGLGINAATNEDFSDYDLSRMTMLTFVPKADRATTLHYKEEFGRWIVTCGIRDLVETYALYMDRLVEACLLMCCSKGLFKEEDTIKIKKDFIRVGIREKYTRLEDMFGIISPGKDCINTISIARNCLVHRLGVVGDIDCDSRGELNIEWMAFDVSVMTKKGEKILLELPIPSEGIRLESEGHIITEYVKRSLTFERGNQVIFSPKELSEICHFFLVSSQELTNLSIAYGRGIGIDILYK